ncbi:putative dead box RNA helicase protein [Rosellinia necatrix]|uniref:ATP-dependent RNA helicase n=1 Tax=Rosellinia necatrix TaxID=77044 RepID=A0A1S7UH73_ROSNE|nr:putative dead box RNA helicase protein [Rosellinia necatrix]
MFKASIQRQVRLGYVARQLCTLSSRRNIRTEHLAVLHQAPASSQPALRHLIPQQALSRLYSTESAAAQVNGEDDSAQHSSGPITRFSELSRLGVNNALIDALTRGMGYDSMTEVQTMSINAALEGTDMVAQAKTGTGKTLAFLVPLFQRVLMDQPLLADRRERRRPSSTDIRAIILSPTRELAEQIGVEARKLAVGTNIVVQTAVGGTRKREALAKMWREGCDILVATPGRLNDLLSDESARVAAPNLQAFVLDEADRMLDVGFADEIRSIQDYLPSPRAVARQTLLFSATIPRDVVHLAKSMVRPDNFKFVQTIKADDIPTHERVPQHLVTVAGMENIYPAILEIAQKGQAMEKESGLPFKAILFFSSTAAVQFAYRVFKKSTSFAYGSGVDLFEIHSKLTQAMRTRSAEQFRRSKSAILFSSDVTARGMDFPNVTDVVQIGLPPDRDQYIHRVGRTGRAGNAGKGWLILTEPEMAEARSRLPGLPITPNHTIETAKHVAGQSPPPEAVANLFRDIDAAYPLVHKWNFVEMYLGSLGQKFGRRYQCEDLVNSLNQWCTYMGWEQPPAIPPKVVQNRALSHIPGIRVGHNDDIGRPHLDEGFGDRRGYDGGRGFGDRRGSGDRNGFAGRSGYGDRNGSAGRSGYGDRNGSSGRSGFGDRSDRSGFGGRSGFSRNNGFGGDRGRSNRDGGSDFSRRSSF